MILLGHLYTYHKEIPFCFEIFVLMILLGIGTPLHKPYCNTYFFFIFFFFFFFFFFDDFILMILFLF